MAHEVSEEREPTTGCVVLTLNGDFKGGHGYLALRDHLATLQRREGDRRVVVLCAGVTGFGTLAEERLRELRTWCEEGGGWVRFVALPEEHAGFLRRMPVYRLLVRDTLDAVLEELRTPFRVEERREAREDSTVVTLGGDLRRVEARATLDALLARLASAQRVVFDCQQLVALHPDDWRRLDALRRAREADGGCVLFAQLDIGKGVMGVVVDVPKKEWSAWTKGTLRAALLALRKVPTTRG